MSGPSERLDEDDGRQWYAYMPQDSLPKHLKIVGWTFVFVGFLALIETLYSLLNNPTININFLIVFIFVGFGLMRRRPVWRSFAMACSFVVFVITMGSLLVVVFGQKSLAAAPKDVQIIYWAQAVIGLAASGYALWALQSKPVRQAFEARS